MAGNSWHHSSGQGFTTEPVGMSRELKEATDYRTDGKIPSTGISGFVIHSLWKWTRAARMVQNSNVLVYR